MISHWDDVDAVRRERATSRGDWQALTGERSDWVGVQRIRIAPGMWSTPLHLEGAEEEIFFVLDGSGVSVQRDGSSEAAYEVGAGDCLVHLALEHAHTLQAGPDGLDVLAFGERHLRGEHAAPARGRLVARPDVGARGGARGPPVEAGGAVGPPEVGELAERPVAHRQRARTSSRRFATGATVARAVRDLGRAAGSFKTGLRLLRGPARASSLNPPHCHSAEEEIFVVLDGRGNLRALATPPARRRARGARGAPRERRRAARRAPGGRTRSARARTGSRVLAYGTRDPRDVTYYPRSGKVNFRGVGLIGRLDVLDYWDGED